MHHPNTYKTELNVNFPYHVISILANADCCILGSGEKILSLALSQSPGEIKEDRKFFLFPPYINIAVDMF